MLRRTITALLMTLVAVPTVHAQTSPPSSGVPPRDRWNWNELSVAPIAEPRAAAWESDTLTSRFVVDGLPVILRRNSANNVVVAHLYLLGGARQITRADAGIEPFLLSVSERGTKNYTKAVIRRKMSLLGSDIVVAPSSDWTLVGIRGTTQVFDSTWAIFADRVMYPSLQPAEVELFRAQFVSAVRQQRDNPDSFVSALADSVAFAGHPYATPIIGTEASARNITAESLRQYHKTQFVKSRMLLVVVGDVSRAHIESLIRKTLSRLPQGSYQWTLPPVLPSTPGAPVLVARDLPTNYILGYCSGPLASATDYYALRVATSVLTGRMFGEIRARQNLTYDVHAPFLDRAATATGLYVTTVAPDTTLKLMRYFVDELKRETLTTSGLRRLELEFITDYFMDNETNASQADFLARAELYQGDYRRAAKFVESLRDVTPDAVRQAAIKYFKNIKFAYVGDTTKVTRALLGSF